MDPGAYVFASLDPANFRNREWRRILARAGIGQRALKDLRDSFASHLLTAGVQLGYLSLALGHADVAVTARHYARWAGGDVYREPLALEWARFRRICWPGSASPTRVPPVTRRPPEAIR